MLHAMQRIALYETILGAFNIKYTSRASIKGQFLSNLAVETAEPLTDEMTEAQHVNWHGLTAWNPLSRMVHVDSTTNQR